MSKLQFITLNHPYPKGANQDLAIQNSWTLTHFTQISQEIETLKSFNLQNTNLDFSKLNQLDTSGCQLIIDLLGADKIQEELKQNTSLKPIYQELLAAVLQAQLTPETTPTQQLIYKFLSPINQLGKQISYLVNNSIQLTAFIGLTLQSLLFLTLQPHKWRFTPLVSNIQTTGLNAVPIVALLTFLVGAVVAYLGATLLTQFGANIYTVHLVSYSFLREFAPLLVAIIVAGRTASSITAQIGSMKVNEELDALKVLGLSAIELLVIPRLLALLIALPLLTFIAMASGIFGGMLVANASLDISFTMFLSVFQQDIEIKHFWIGMAKAPFFAFIIIIISCLEGFKVSNSAESVGKHTTSSVVQSIFMVIVIDAIFALISMEMGW